MKYTHLTLTLILGMALAIRATAAIVSLQVVDLTISGGDNLEFFGSAITSGDINGDGKNDTIIGGGTSGPNKIYVIFNKNYLPGTFIDLGVSNPDIEINGGLIWRFMSSRISSGDINGDGYDDVIAGAYGAGSILIFYGGNFDANKIILSPDVIFIGDDFGALGWSLDATDVNGDGKADIVSGDIKYNSLSASHTGKTYIIFGRNYESGSTINIGPYRSGMPDPTEADIVINGKNEHDRFGYAVATGDIDNDKITDIFVGAPGASDSGPNTGSVYVFYGKNLTHPPINLSANNADLTIAGSNFDYLSSFGASLAVGDVNKDGFDDIVSGQNNSFLSSTAPRLYLIYGRKINPSQINLTNYLADLIITEEISHSAFGFSLRSGDVNADGRKDIIIGSPNAFTANGQSSGATYVIYGKSFHKDIMSAADADIKIYGNSANDELGFNSASEDINGDGNLDILISASSASSQSYLYSGKVYVLYGKSNNSGSR